MKDYSNILDLFNQHVGMEIDFAGVQDTTQNRILCLRKLRELWNSQESNNPYYKEGLQILQLELLRLYTKEQGEAL